RRPTSSAMIASEIFVGYTMSRLSYSLCKSPILFDDKEFLPWKFCLRMIAVGLPSFIPSPSDPYEGSPVIRRSVAVVSQQAQFGVSQGVTAVLVSAREHLLIEILHHDRGRFVGDIPERDDDVACAGIYQRAGE